MPPFPLVHAVPWAAYVSILLSEVEQEQIPSGNSDREAIVVGAGLWDGEGERAYTVFDLILVGKKYLKFVTRFQEQNCSKNGTIRSQISRSIFDLAFRSHKTSISKYPTVTWPKVIWLKLLVT